MSHDILFEVIGNTSPFSLTGESSGYMITVNNRVYLLECGAPIFPTLGYGGIADIKGIFCTHSHEDHKRWFTDIVLFTFYNPLLKHRLRLISSEVILEEFAKNSKGALERSLSLDSKRIVDIPYSQMVEEQMIGPRSKYSIKLKTDNNGGFKYSVEDRHGNVIGPEKAKIFINPAANRPRLLFKDDETGEWVEPESYYPFSSTVFYEKDQNIFYDEYSDLTVKAKKCSAWHGVPTIAFKFMSGKSNLLFSADTVWKPSLWKELYEEYRPQSFQNITRDNFEKSSIIYGDINDFIERTWSKERYEDAMKAYEGSIIIHDVARKNSVVHTDYPDIANAPFEKLIYTHNPDNITALRPILSSGKRIIIKDGDFYELIKDRLYPFDADVYIRHFGCDYVGYKSKKGLYKVIEKDGLLGVVGYETNKKGLMRVDLYQDIRGEYFPVITDADRCYKPRPDGQVEEITMHKDSSIGKVVKNIRGLIR
jgi:ribonuclease BN (tRNA processing enzyme)